MNTMIAGVLLWMVAVGAAWADSASLLAQAKATKPERVRYAETQGAATTYTSDGKSFYVWWQPSNPSGVLVMLHGHGSWAYDEFYLLHSAAKARNLAFLALQWWFGGGETNSDYYTPNDMYPLVAQILRDRGVAPGSAIFGGYSRGSANTYAMAALDGSSGNRFFRMMLSVAGGAASDYPYNRDVESGRWGSSPFAGYDWVMYCGELDANPDRDGCPAMRKARDWVTRYGASFKLLIEDAAGDHGGFTRSGANHPDTALAQFAPANPYADAERIFDWAETVYPALLTPATKSQVNYGYYYRCYSGNRCLGATLTDLYWYDGAITRLGSVASYLAQVR